MNPKILQDGNYMLPIVIGENYLFLRDTIATGGVLLIAVDPSSEEYAKFNPELKFNTHSIMSTVLLPPYGAIEAYLEGDTQKSYGLYRDWIIQNQFNVYSLLAAAFRDISVTIYFGEEELVKPFVEMFMQIMYECYGISMTRSFNMDFINCPLSVMRVDCVATVLTNLFMADLIDTDTFLYNFPTFFAPMVPEAISKLNFILKPVLAPNQDASQYYTDYANHNQSSLKPLIDPMVAL